MQWVRIDNRLVHGQVIETWLPFTGAKFLVVVNDELAADTLQQEIMSLAIPNSTTPLFIRVDEIQSAMAELADKGRHPSEMLFLFEGCADARRAYDYGFSFSVLNIGNIHYGPGKLQVSPSVALGSDDETCLRFFSRKGVELDFRCVPNDPNQVKFK